MMTENSINKTFSKDYDFLKEKFLDSFFDVLKSQIDKERIVIGLSWWNSLKIFYEKLRKGFHIIDAEIRNKIYFCFIDERVVEFEDDFSNYKLVKNLFLDELVNKWLVKQENIFLPDFNIGDFELDYFNKVKNIDIWLFWVWEDWHIWSLFPNHILLENNNFSYLKIDDSSKPPLTRITISKSMIKKIENSFIFFMWNSKKMALGNFLDENILYNDCPAKLVLDSENVYLFSDIFTKKEI